jgi:hypothetical protein
VFSTKEVAMLEDDVYWKACEALERRCKRRGWIYDQPSRYDSEITNKGIIILRNINGELGRYDTRKHRLITPV